VEGSHAGGTLHVLARRSKGVVLLRVVCDAAGHAGADDVDGQLDVVKLRTLVEAAGGTLMAERERDRLVLSVRLDLAAALNLEKRVMARAN
jgi:hypothetical protein